ncbi:P-type conjugative transfer protein TrbJ [Sphingobium phenoxybenzoativorans]|uniref:P-type conjugative transfer protein TrbJ n=1 Tax=Sphingobium phenoxybenzoativorans TaxID=1592790 RepID=UPI0008722456|nr:P-type conjugative transfer protein TrbJ [Sphingobium phenoxybenzoativorans]
MKHFPVQKYMVAAVMGLAAGASLGMALIVPATPARAFVVFDPSNYAQNLLTAARALNQINNQIKSLQNETMMLGHMAKNLTRIDFPQLRQITQSLEQIDHLMGEAQSIGFRMEHVDEQYRSLFPAGIDSNAGTASHVTQARARLSSAMAAFKQTMEVQGRVVENVESDGKLLAAMVAKSQDAEGALQVAQATNQLLALTAKQQFQIQAMMAAQYRAESIEKSRRAQAEADAQAATRKFLGSGTAYTPR